MMQKIFIFLFVMGLASTGFGQPWFPDKGQVFNTSIIPRVDIKIDEDSLAWIYDNVKSDYEFKAQFIFTTDLESDTLNDIGFRLRGNTSRNSQKKSFKISFNTFQPGRKFYGLEKMNLNGEHNDPSVIRSHLTWNIFNQMRVPGSRSNHVDVYINNRYYGLYMNVEHVDEEFVESRYENKLGNLYKCIYPANLAYLGTDKNAYKSNGYELMTNTDKDDFSDLINFTNVINNTSSELMPIDIEPIFNMNGFIRYLAVEIFTGHWDAYSVNKNNYYLFNNYYTNKFEFIPYDVDNTFGIDWFNIDWGNRDIYNWWADWEDRLLTSKTFGNQVYRDRFSFFMNELINNYAAEDTLFPIIDGIQNKINASAELDPYRPLDYGWSFNDFKRSYTEALGAHVKYGLKPYITQRISSIKQQLVLNPIAPIIENVYHNFPNLSEGIIIKADITDDEPNYTAKIHYTVNGGAQQSMLMTDQGNRLFNVILPAFTTSGKLSYYIESTDASSRITREPYSGEYTINIGAGNADLLINEFMASNQTTIVDNYGEYEDWIEIYNTGTQPVSLSGKYLSDDLMDRTKWNFPAITLPAGAYYVIWADNDTEQGNNHANFKLSQAGEAIGIFDSFESNFAPIDTLTYNPQVTDYSSGRDANNTVVTQNFITPGGENGSSDLSYITFAYNMNKQIDEGNFIKDVDFIDIAGTFNDWAGGVKIYDGNADGLHEATLFGFASGNEIQYKARILADWSGGEFPELGGDGNRLYTLVGGANILYHWFNDDAVGITDNMDELVINVYPNPVNTQSLNIRTNVPIQKVEIFNLSGTLINTFYGNMRQYMSIDHQLKTGIYIVKIDTGATPSISKIVVY